MNGGPQYQFNEAISFQIPCNDHVEIDKFWDILVSDGGKESQCGWCKDKYGVSWQVISPKMGTFLGGENKEGAQRVLKWKKKKLI